MTDFGNDRKREIAEDEREKAIDSFSNKRTKNELEINSIEKEIVRVEIENKDTSHLYQKLAELNKKFKKIEQDRDRELAKIDRYLQKLDRT